MVLWLFPLKSNQTNEIISASKKHEYNYIKWPFMNHFWFWPYNGSHWSATCSLLRKSSINTVCKMLNLQSKWIKTVCLSQRLLELWMLKCYVLMSMLYMWWSWIANCKNECIRIGLLYVCYKLEVSFEYMVACNSTVLNWMSTVSFQMIQIIFYLIING